MCVALVRGGWVLLALRAATGASAGASRWEVPQCDRHWNESPHAAAERLAAEQLGVGVRAEELLWLCDVECAERVLVCTNAEL